MTGTVRSISASICRSTADSAPKLETSAMRPGKSSSIASLSSDRASRRPYCALRSAVSAKLPAAGSAATASASSSAIEGLVERRLAQPPIGGKKILLRTLPVLQIGIEQRLDGVDHLGAREAMADDLADRGLLVAGAGKRELIEFLALLLDAENADVADVMMAAGIDAAGDLDLELADLRLPRLAGKALGDPLRHRDGAGIGERAIVEPRTGDDVGDEAGIGRREIGLV